MTDYTLSPYASRFIRATMRPLANVALGIDATVDVGGAEWAVIAAELTAAEVGDDDVLVCSDSPIDGTGQPTFGQVKAVITLLATIGPLIKAQMTPLSILHTHITLPD